MLDNKILLTYVLTDIIFVVSGGLLIIFALTTESETSKAPTIKTVSRNLLLMQCPLSAAIGNGILVFVSFLLSIPAMIMPMTRGWLKVHGYMVVVCALFTMVLGLDIWFETLKTRANLGVVFSKSPDTTKSLLQQSLDCCGYNNSTSPPFVVDATCPNAAIAAATVGCITPFTKFANNFLDLIFTGAFGIVGIDVCLVLATAMLLKDRKEKERYRHIDEKNGTGRI